MPFTLSCHDDNYRQGKRDGGLAIGLAGYVAIITLLVLANRNTQP